MQIGTQLQIYADKRLSASPDFILWPIIAPSPAWSSHTSGQHAAACALYLLRNGTFCLLGWWRNIGVWKILLNCHSYLFSLPTSSLKHLKGGRYTVTAKHYCHLSSTCKDLLAHYINHISCHAYVQSLNKRMSQCPIRRVTDVNNVSDWVAAVDVSSNHVWWHMILFVCFSPFVVKVVCVCVCVAAFTSITHIFKIPVRRTETLPKKKKKKAEHQKHRMEQITTYMKHLSLSLKRTTLDLNGPLN